MAKLLLAATAVPPARLYLANPRGLRLAPDGSLFVADSMNLRLRRTASCTPTFPLSDVLLPAANGNELYLFDPSGRHLRTFNALTGATLYQFEYDSAGRLNHVTDGDGNVTTIEHDANGILPQLSALSASAPPWRSMRMVTSAALPIRLEESIR